MTSTEKIAQAAYQAGVAEAIKEASIGAWFKNTNPISRLLTNPLGSAGMGATSGAIAGSVLGPGGTAVGGLVGGGVGALSSLINRGITRRATLGNANLMRQARGKDPLGSMGLIGGRMPEELANIGNLDPKIIAALLGGGAVAGGAAGYGLSGD